MAEEPGAEQGAAGRWLTIAQAARTLGVTERAIRRRIERGTVEARRDTAGNRVRTLVRVPGAVPAPHGGTGSGTGRVLDPVQDALASLRERTARLEERLAASEEARGELRRELAEVKAERDRLLALVEQLAAERRQRRPWPGLRAWWRRV